MWSGWAVTPPGSMVTTTSGCSPSRNRWMAVVRASRSACSTWPSTYSPKETRSTPTAAMAARSSASRTSGRVSRVAPDPWAIWPAWPRVAVQTTPRTPLGTSRANDPASDQVSSSGWAKIPATVSGRATGHLQSPGGPAGSGRGSRLPERRPAQSQVVQPLDQAPGRLVEDGREHAHVVAADGEHLAVEVAPLGLDQRQVAVQGAGLGLAAGLQGLQVDADRLVGVAAARPGHLLHLGGQLGQQVVDRDAVEDGQPLQPRHRDAALAPLVGAEDAGLELFGGALLHIVEGKALLQADVAEPFADLLLVAGHSDLLRRKPASVRGL